MCYQYAIIYTTCMGRFIVDEEHCPEYSESETCSNYECFQTWLDEECPLHMVLNSISNDDLGLSDEDSDFTIEILDFSYDDSGFLTELLVSPLDLLDSSLELLDSPNETPDFLIGFSDSPSGGSDSE